MKIFALGVAEPSENIRAWVEEHELSYPVISDADGVTFRQYSNGSVPYNVIIDQNFKVRYSGNGFEEKEFLKIMGDLSE